VELQITITTGYLHSSPRARVPIAISSFGAVELEHEIFLSTLMNKLYRSLTFIKSSRDGALTIYFVIGSVPILT
jgi:hypothetical protein